MEFWQPDPIFGHHQLCIDLAEGCDLTETFRHINDHDAEMVLLSCEGFQGLHPDRLATLRQLLGDADVKIVIFLRRWSDWIPSQWVQSVKQGSIKTFNEYYWELLLTARRHPGINNKIILNRFAQVFGHVAISILPYSNLLDAGEDIFAVFARDILGWTVPAAAQPKLVHASMDIRTTELARCLNVLDQRAGRHEGVLAAIALGRVRQQTEAMSAIYATMRRFVGTIVIDDGADLFRPIFAELNAAYGDRVIGAPEVFEPKARAFEYIQTDFLLTPGMPASIARMHQELVGS
jgi:hypothetical protein